MHNCLWLGAGKPTARVAAENAQRLLVLGDTLLSIKRLRGTGRAADSSLQPQVVSI